METPRRQYDVLRTGTNVSDRTFRRNTRMKRNYDASINEGPSKRIHDDISTFERESEYEESIDLIDSSLSPACDDNEQVDLLYQTCRISKKDSSLLILAFVSRYSLTRQGVDDLLNLINMHLPEDLVPKSSYLLKKVVSHEGQVRKHFVCQLCKSVIPLHNSYCIHCKSEEASFFLSLDLETSLQTIMRIPEIQLALQSTFEKRKHENECITDITDGEEYKKLQLLEHDITFTLNCDGIAAFDSSTFSLWPLFVSINELPYHLRRKYTILCLLWHGKEKPNFELLFCEFGKVYNELHSNGMQWTLNGVGVHSKMHVCMLSCDSVARAPILAMTQFNGRYSCPWCLIEGSMSSSNPEDRDRRWVFVPSKKRVEQRDLSTYLLHLKQLEMERMQSKRIKQRFGLKERSPLLFIDDFDIINGQVYDYMHSCALGVAKYFTMAWLNSKYHSRLFYIGRKENLIDAKLERCLLPSECNRSTRSITQAKLWKANEWKMWILLSVFVVKNILPDPYYKHFCKFSEAVFLLCQQKITNADVKIAEKLILEFVRMTESLYGTTFCTYNLHLLTHAPGCVQKWGPLWAYSTFQFEHNNGMLTEMFNGSQQVAIQVATRVTQNLKVASMTDSSTTSNVKCFMDSLLFNSRFFSKSQRAGPVTYVGPSKLYYPNESECATLNNFEVSAESCYCFKKCIFKRNVYKCWSGNSKHRCDAIVSSSGKLYVIQALIFVQLETGSALALFSGLRCKATSTGKFTIKISDVDQNPKLLELNKIDHCKYACILGSFSKPCLLIKMPNCIEID